MELDQATEQFYEKLSERLREKGFSTRIIEDGCLEVTSEKIRGKQKTHCAVLAAIAPSTLLMAFILRDL